MKKSGDNPSRIPIKKTPKVQGRTVKWVVAVVLAAISIFLVLAMFDMAGIVGQAGYRLLTLLLGDGYLFVPAGTALAAIFIVKPPDERPNFVHISAIVLMIFAGFGLFATISPEVTGILGSVVGNPMRQLFDLPAGILILATLICISLLLLFEPDVSELYHSLKGRLKNTASLLHKIEVRTGKPEVVGVNGAANLSQDNEAPIAEEETSKTDSHESSDDKKSGAVKLNVGRDSGSENESADPKQAKFKNYDKKETAAYGLVSTNLSKPYAPPPISLLEGDRGKPGVGDIKANANIIKRALQNFDITVEIEEVSVGPSVTRYALKPAQGVKLSKIVGLKSDLSLALAAHPIRIEAPIPGKSLVGIEIPNTSKTTVGLGSLLSTTAFSEGAMPLTIALGKDIAGNAHYGNISKMPHLLIAGATGSGKSVMIHAIITSLLFRNPPAAVRFLMVDPKRVELTTYNNIPHLLMPVVTNAKEVLKALRWAAGEMERRYTILETEEVRDIHSYHVNIFAPALKQLLEKKSRGTISQKDFDMRLPERLPYIVIVIDELADIMQAYPRELEASVVRIAQMSRAVGIHLVLSTQRPSVNVITGLIKANIPARVALQVASQVDSRTILDTSGAETLLGAGDMLYISGDMSKPLRLQSPYVSEEEIKKVVDYLHKNCELSDYDIIDVDLDAKSSSLTGKADLDIDDGAEIDDELYEEARELVVRTGKASTSYLQRKLRIGYARAARLIDVLEERGVVGPGEGAKPREVLAGNRFEDLGGDTNYKDALDKSV